MFRRRKPEEPNSDAVPQPPDTLTGRAVSDNGLGVPPFRPGKEVTSMGKSYIPSPTPTGTARPTAASRRDSAERRTLVVGRGISLQGTVQDAERLVVEGTVEASLIHAAELAIPQGGVFKGSVEVDDAEVAGTLDGTLTVRGTLILRATGKLLGTAKYRKLQVEEGGQISGQLQTLTDEASASSTNRLPPALVQDSAAE